MIIARSPMRISLGGGGTDLPSYYEQHTGFLVAAAINKYVYITLNETFAPGLLLKYSKLERAESAAQIEHPIFREAFSLLGIEDRSLGRGTLELQFHFVAHARERPEVVRKRYANHFSV